MAGEKRRGMRLGVGLEGHWRAFDWTLSGKGGKTGRLPPGESSVLGDRQRVWRALGVSDSSSGGRRRLSRRENERWRL